MNLGVSMTCCQVSARCPLGYFFDDVAHWGYYVLKFYKDYINDDLS